VLFACNRNAGRSQMAAGWLTADAVQASDVVITMGCGDECAYYPGTRYLDWPLDDPAGQGIDAVRPIRDQIKANVEQLIAELLPDATAS
jgi:arsenate reductase (thioredoxin)